MAGDRDAGTDWEQWWSRHAHVPPVEPAAMSAHASVSRGFGLRSPKKHAPLINLSAPALPFRPLCSLAKQLREYEEQKAAAAADSAGSDGSTGLNGSGPNGTPGVGAAAAQVSPQAV